MTLSGADIAQLLSAHGLKPSRALGQNFVTDPNTVRRIARLSGAGPGSDVLEIGAGLGSLTWRWPRRAPASWRWRPIATCSRSCAPSWRAGVEIVEGDALELDLAALLAERSPGPWSLVANLPYNVATPLVLRTLVEVPAVAHLLVMVQREVGERMAAAAGEEAYGAVSVRIASFARAELVGRVPASVLKPPADGWRRWSSGWAPARAGRRSRPGLLRAARRARPGRLRRATKDAAAFPGRRGRSGRLRDGRRRPDARARSSTWRRGAGWRHCEQSRGERCRVTGVRSQILAPAKLTVTLRVTGGRADELPQPMPRCAA